jgi:hypothetical protein
MIEDTARVSWVYETGTGGTPPYVTSMDFANDAAPDAGDLGALLVGCQDAWNDNITQFISNTLGGGHADGLYQRSADVLEGTVPIDDGDDGAGSLETMGFSYRVIKIGARPTGGRRGSMFIMGAQTDGFDGTGAISSGAIQGAVNDFFVALQGITDWHPIQTHNVGGTPTVSTVLSLSLAPTVSFLRRRYR